MRKLWQIAAFMLLARLSTAQSNEVERRWRMELSTAEGGALTDVTFGSAVTFVRVQNPASSDFTYGISSRAITLPVGPRRNAAWKLNYQGTKWGLSVGAWREAGSSEVAEVFTSPRRELSRIEYNSAHLWGATFFPPDTFSGPSPVSYGVQSSVSNWGINFSASRRISPTLKWEIGVASGRFAHAEDTSISFEEEFVASNGSLFFNSTRAASESTASGWFFGPLFSLHGERELGKHFIASWNASVAFALTSVGYEAIWQIQDRSRFVEKSQSHPFVIGIGEFPYSGRSRGLTSRIEAQATLSHKLGGQAAIGATLRFSSWHGLPAAARLNLSDVTYDVLSSTWELPRLTTASWGIGPHISLDF